MYTLVYEKSLVRYTKPEPQDYPDYPNPQPDSKHDKILKTTNRIKTTAI